MAKTATRNRSMRLANWKRANHVSKRAKEKMMREIQGDTETMDDEGNSGETEKENS